MFLETEKLIARCIPGEEELLRPAPRSVVHSEGGEGELLLPASLSPCPSPASSEGGTYTQDLLAAFTLNLHRPVVYKTDL